MATAATPGLSSALPLLLLVLAFTALTVLDSEHSAIAAVPWAPQSAHGEAATPASDASSSILFSASAAAADNGAARSYLDRYARTLRSPGTCWRAPAGAPRIAVVGFMKDEAHVLREWLEHYFWQGVDAILLLDNGSTDAWRDVLRDFPRAEHLAAPRRHAQEAQYNELAVPWLYERGIALVIVVDLDEFLFSRDERSLQEVLLEFFFGDAEAESAVGALFMPWISFGSSGHVTQPLTVREHFTWRANASLVRDFIDNGKSVARVSMLTKLGIHRQTIGAGTTTIAGDRFVGEHFLPAFSRDDALYGPLRSDMGRAGPPLQLNHYPIQSWACFESVKMRRGAADKAQFENVRDRLYFERYDFHEVEDLALEDFVARARANSGTRHDYRCQQV